jgi:hypothetical protein
MVLPRCPANSRNGLDHGVGHPLLLLYDVKIASLNF